MKKNIFIIVLSICLCGCNTKKYSGEMDVVNSRTLSFDNCYSEDITVILNLPQITDYEECAKTIIRHYFKDDFESTTFDFDEVGYPNELEAIVFLTKDDLKAWKPIFKMSYRTNSFEYNIKENPEHCILEIKEIVDK